MNDVDGLTEAGIDPSEVATEFAAVMFDQLFLSGYFLSGYFLSGYFHADPHPGNIFVTPLPRRCVGGGRNPGLEAAFYRLQDDGRGAQGPTSGSSQAGHRGRIPRRHGNGGWRL